MRLIDADALKVELAKNITIWTFNVSYDGILAEIIDNAPTVDIPCNDCCADTYRDGYEKGKADARLTGEWKEKVETKQLGYGWLTAHEIVCSVCGGSGENDENIPQCWKFCPNCGADMRGEEP